VKRNRPLSPRIQGTVGVEKRKEKRNEKGKNASVKEITDG
jgi:hypothetical protein